MHELRLAMAKSCSPNISISYAYLIKSTQGSSMNNSVFWDAPKPELCHGPEFGSFFARFQTAGREGPASTPTLHLQARVIYPLSGMQHAKSYVSSGTCEGPSGLASLRPGSKVGAIPPGLTVVSVSWRHVGSVVAAQPCKTGGCCLEHRIMKDSGSSSCLGSRCCTTWLLR